MGVHAGNPGVTVTEVVSVRPVVVRVSVCLDAFLVGGMDGEKETQPGGLVLLLLLL